MVKNGFVAVFKTLWARTLFFKVIISIESGSIAYFYRFIFFFFHFLSLTPLIGFLYVLGPLLFSRFVPVTDSYNILEIAKYYENIVLCKQVVFFVQECFFV